MRLPDFSKLTRRRGRQADQPGLQRSEALNAVPLRNPAIEWETQESGRVILTIPLEFKPWMKLLKVVAQIPDHKKVELDELGSNIWLWADGGATVETLVGQLADEHKLNRREAEVSLMQFLETLAKRRFMAFAVDVDEKRAEELQAQAGKQQQK